MAAELPVLTSDRSALPEAAGGAALLVSPDDVAAIRDGMQRLSEDAGLRRRLAELGLKRAERLTWKKTAALTWQAYRDAGLL